MLSKKILADFDYILFFLVFGIAVFGILIIGSATRINISGGDGEFKVK